MPPNSTSYVPDNKKLLTHKLAALDGLRAVAILLVLAYHFLPSFSFAWVGVDLFFVLSGFLITGKLVEASGAAHYFRNFYVKRIKRIVPLYFSVLLLFFVLVPQILPGFITSSWHALINKQIYYWTFTANIDDALHGWPANISLIHCWSLACEMQFYLLWPWVIYVLYPKLPWLISLLLAGCVAALFCRMYLSNVFNAPAVARYVLLPCRLDAFCMGALLYLAAQKQLLQRYTTRLMILAGLVLLAVLMIVLLQKLPWHFGQQGVNQFGFTLNALVWTCVLAVTIAGEEMFWHRWMKSSWMVWTGKYSYGMYVLHLPVYFLLGRISWFSAAVKDKTLLMAVIALVITCICSWLSYQLLEKRFLTLKPVNECAR